MKCSKCGEKVDNNSKFCPKCGNPIQHNHNNKTNFNNSINNPKLILFAILVLIFILGINSMINSDSDSNNLIGQEITVYGHNFHVPEGYKETSRKDYTNGEYVDLQKDNENGWAIEISVSSDMSFEKSENIEASVPYTINNKQGTLYSYKSGGMTYVYYDNGDLVVIRHADTDELKQIII